MFQTCFLNTSSCASEQVVVLASLAQLLGLLELARFAHSIQIEIKSVTSMSI